MLSHSIYALQEAQQFFASVRPLARTVSRSATRGSPAHGGPHYPPDSLHKHLVMSVR
jgi:hypothetical protein